MLDADTKRRIDTARDILVGKVPDPKSQVEQITIALIYKFMDDLDAESEELGGKRSFFAGDFARYGWSKLMRSGLGGHEMLGLYAEAIVRMPENPGIPPLFRTIFNNAYLPYRDPETLRAFLKIIDEFTYDHSERLGDAYEYLLSVLGSQGDAGQFRTPRHIIDFIVAVVDPKKDETVLDPACGTAGFLISSYKHILAANTDKAGNSTLTPDDRGRLAANIMGYDISPDMVRLSLVNMYLHEFVDPQIVEYDTLTSDERWNDFADVILANPPFMSPKGGIRPHNRFSVQSKRSEVLFVDYMAEHLTANGRAGFIVPEGIIFQIQNAYKQLRKLLVEEYLVAVVSLPAGVFNPYSGVKTSILFLDKALAKKTDHIAFFKVENDGFDLGAQRKPIERDDLPQVQRALQGVLNSDAPSPRVYGEELQENEGDLLCFPCLLVPKSDISANDDYNLSGERYKGEVTDNAKYEWVELGAITLDKAQYGSGARKAPYDGKLRYVRITDITDSGELKPDDPVSPSVAQPEYLLRHDDLLVVRSGSVGRSYLHEDLPGKFQYAGYLIRFRIDPTKAIPRFVFYVTKSNSWREWIQINSKTGTLSNINAKQYSAFSFPLPPLEVQQEIVAEIEGYQRVYDGARAVIDNYRPHIPIDPGWPLMEIGDCCEVKGGKRLPKGVQFSTNPTPHPYIRVVDFREQTVGLDDLKYISSEVHEEISRYTVSYRDVYISIAGTIGLMGTIPEELDGANLTENAAKLVLEEKVIDKRFLAYLGNGDFLQAQVKSLTHAVGVPKLALQRIRTLRIPAPPLRVQQSIVAEIEAEQALVAANRELIERMEGKIQQTIERVWE